MICELVKNILNSWCLDRKNTFESFRSTPKEYKNTILRKYQVGDNRQVKIIDLS